MLEKPTALSAALELQSSLSCAMLPKGTVFLPDLRVDHLIPWRLKMSKRFLLQPV